MPTPRRLAIIASAIRTTQNELLEFMESKHPEHMLTCRAVGGFFKGKTDAEVYHYIETKVFPSAIQIKNKDLKFFSENKYKIFEGLKQAYIDEYANLVLNSSKEDQESYWSFFQRLIEIYEVSLKSKKNS